MAETDNSVAKVSNEKLSATRKKYEEEAKKRLSRDSSSKYLPLTDAEESRIRSLGDDPWVDHGKLNQRPSPIKENSTYRFFILGAGFGGLQFAVRLIESKLATADEIRILDSAGGFGGTWYWNRYPGLHCDIESYIYLPLLEETGYVPTQKYATGAEVRGQAERIAAKWNLTDSTQFRSEVKRVEWDESSKLWNIAFTENRGPSSSPVERRFRSQYVYLAAGGLTQPQVPRIPGLSSFSGNLFHTARWDYQVSGGSQDDQTLTGLSDKRVAVIGTAATAIGVIPEIAKYAKKLYVIQRTPANVKPRNQRITDPQEFKTSVANTNGWQRERQLNWNRFITNSAKPGEQNLVADGWTTMPAYSALLGSPSHGIVDPSPENLEKHVSAFHELDLPTMEAVRARVEKLVEDPKTSAKLKPWYPSWCKRPTFSDTYLQTFNKPNVELIDTDGQGPSQITERGIVVGGKEYELDVIVFSTGYQLSTTRAVSPSAKSKITVVGRNGQSLDEKWLANGVTTLHGYLTSDFPNLFFTGTSQATATGNNVFMLGFIAHHIAFIISEAHAKLGSQSRPIIEATKAGEEAHTKEILRRAPFFSTLAGCTPSYFNGHGDAAAIRSEEQRLKRARGSIWSEGARSYLDYLEQWRNKGTLDGLRITPADGLQIRSNL
ncbi:unnamed protein product [Clonostachys rosea]|uniref:FAD/NAD(P)-binding domain-containing protein n=1 Tax=Bionectria ochroleuca TaxID=29856 RepID=A0ABY6UG09_BIOOC|nr:unnamed protein product [Clonostachys rosea]